MRKQSEWVLKAILSRSPEDKRKELESFLPQSERDRLDEMPVFLAEVAVEEPPLIERVHWSWFLSALKSHSVDEQKLFLSAAPLVIKSQLSYELGFSSPPDEPLKEVAKKFLNQALLESVTGSVLHLLPTGFLPPSPLTPLLHLTKHELIRLIDFLSLYDLAEELRQIVETKILKKIYSFLSEEEKRFLKQAAAVKQSYAARLKLDSWDGQEESFRNLLHKRGIVRLGAALSSQNPHFCWYVCHILDIGRGTALSKSCATEVTHDISDSIIRQIESILEQRENLS